MSFESRFWSRVQKGDNCWNWIAGTFTNGYGQFRIDGLPKKAHRVSYALANGPIPEGEQVLHKCDNRRCVNPEHLFLGSQADNMADRNAKGRQARGRAHGMSKITEADVLSIRSMGGRLEDIGRHFGLVKSVVSNIKNRKTWQHVTP